MNIHLVMFSTPIKFGVPNYYQNSIKQMIESAKKWGIENFHLYSPDNLSVAKYIQDWMESTLDPGYGYYSWKPLIILDVMNNINDGDVILYHDAGRKEYNFEFRKDINILIKDVIDNYNGIGIAQGNFLHKQWCKKDCFVKMGCNTEEYTSLNQLSATWGIWQKNPLSLQILNDWKQTCFDPSGIVTTNDTVGKLSDFDDFKEHRWDQAIITNLLFKYKFNNFDVKPLIPPPGKWEKDINNFINND